MPNRCAPTYYHRVAKEQKKTAQNAAYFLFLFICLALGVAARIDHDTKPAAVRNLSR